MSKRNVVNTATIDVPVRKSKLGIPENMNIAAIADLTTHLSSITGEEKKKQDAHDGSSFLNYVYSKMIDASYPLKGYKGTKKQFGTFISEFGVTIKKDAENVITNQKILNSKGSEINLAAKQKQMLDIKFSSEFKDFSFEKEFGNTYFYNKGGVIYRIDSLEVNSIPDSTLLSVSINVSKKLGDS